MMTVYSDTSRVVFQGMHEDDDCYLIANNTVDLAMPRGVFFSLLRLKVDPARIWFRGNLYYVLHTRRSLASFRSGSKYFFRHTICRSQQVHVELFIGPTTKDPGSCSSYDTVSATVVYGVRLFVCPLTDSLAGSRDLVCRAKVIARKIVCLPPT